MNTRLKTKKISLSNIYFYMFSLFILFNCIFYKSFSKLNIDYGVLDYIYITEYFLIISFLYILIFSSKIKNFKRNDLSGDLAIPTIIIIYSLLLLLIKDNNTDLIFVIREIAPIAYLSFYLIVITEFNDSKKSERLYKTILFAAVISMLVIFLRYIFGIGNITTTYNLNRYGNYEFVGIITLQCFSIINYFKYKKNKYMNLMLIISTILTINLFIVHRSATLGSLISILIIFYILNKKINYFKYFIYILIGLICLLVISNITDFNSSTLLINSINRITGVINNDIFRDPNVSWRLYLWKYILENLNIISSIFGTGWGFPIPEFILNNQVYSEGGIIGYHNSILYIFVHTGIIGITLFSIFILNIYYEAYKILKSLKLFNNIIERRILSLLASNVGILVFSCYNVVLEGPYMSIVFWVTLGLLNNYTRIYNHQKKLEISVFKEVIQ